VSDDIDYGPLSGLVGVWKGDKGMDVAPDPDGAENNPYYETIDYTACGDVSNAESQLLAVVHYRQIVQRKSNDQVFHDETGYWMWDAGSGVIMHALTIPRGVSVLAGGVYTGTKTPDEQVILEVSAAVDDKDWQIIQSPFMQKNARTTAFHHRLAVGNDRLSYSETTIVDIYGKVFEHTDQNELTRQ
jgi:hypothetical protein